MNKAGIVFFFILLPFFVSAESSVDLKFLRENWNIAIESFSGTLSPDFEYLKNSIPDLIKQELDSSEYHVLSSSEISFYRSSIVDEADIKVINELSQYYTDRDQLLFDKNSTSAALDDINTKISLLNDDRLKLAFIDESLIKTAEMLKISWIANDIEMNLLKGGIYQSSVTMKQYDLDFLISGSIREIEGYFLLEVNGYNRSSGEKINLFSNTGSIEDIEDIALAASNELRSVILGRPWSILLVVTDSPDALIYADGELIGVGTAEVKTAYPGSIFLEAIGYDNSYWARNAELASFKISEFSGILSQSEIDFVTLDTNPAQADVYIGVRWTGKTPLKLPRYRERNLWVTVKSEGYYDRSFEVSQDSPESLFFELIEEDLTELEIFEMRKKQYYRSLGRFSVSVAVPVISWGIFMNSLEEKQANISQSIFWGSIGISGGLLADVFVKLSRYIKAAEALAE